MFLLNLDMTTKLESDMYNSTRSSGHIDASATLPAPENTTPGMLPGFCQRLQPICDSVAPNQSTENNLKSDEVQGKEDESMNLKSLRTISPNRSVRENFQSQKLHHIYRGERCGRVVNPIAGSKPIQPK